MSRSRTTAQRAIALAAITAIGSSIPLTASAQEGASSDVSPKNVIVLIGDGMGYNQVDLASAYQYGTTHHQVVVDPARGSVQHVPGTASQVYQSYDVQTSMSHYAANGRAEYDPTAAWAAFDWVLGGPTDSAAAGTALATGVKTTNGTIGLDPSGRVVENLTERATALGKATGVVTSVPFSHATPAAYGSHIANRNDLAGVTSQYLAGDLDVVIGAGHPYFDDNAQPLATPSYGYVTESDWNRLVDNQTGFTLVDDTAGLTDLATAAETPERVFGAVPVATTLQYNRTGAVGSAAPYSVPENAVPDLATLSLGALNVLDQEEEGFAVMIEGGAIDWAGHANSAATMIEEVVDFNRAVEAVTTWVETNSSWDETLVIVTADHETGYLNGPGANPGWTAISGAAGAVPAHSFHSGNHSNALVPLYAQGAGAEALAARATGTDPVRGAYLDNTDVANFLLQDLWDVAPTLGEGEIPVEVTVEETLPGEGSLVMTVQDAAAGVGFGDPATRGDRLSYTGTLPTVSVTDSRGGDLGGWTVSGRAGDLTTGLTEAGVQAARDADRVLRAGYLSWEPRVLTGNPGAAAGPATTGQLDGGAGLAESATLVSADRASRAGTTEVSAGLELDVPVDTRAGTYQGTLTVSLFPVD